MSAACAQHIKNARGGFTLVEVLATMVILGTLGSVVSALVYRSARTYSDAAGEAQLHSELATGMDRIDRELREIPIKTPAATVVPDIASTTATSITWTTDASLSLSGTNLMLAEKGLPAAVLLSNVSAFSVQTYNESNTALAAALSGSGCDPIRRIQVSVSVTRGGWTETLRTKVFLRSTMSGAAP